MYNHSEFQGDAYILDKGEYATSEAWGGDNDELSSLRALPQGEAIVLFKDTHLRGRGVTLTGNCLNLGSYGYNDKVSSLIVMRGKWILLDDDNFKGNSFSVSSTGGDNGVYLTSDAWGEGNDELTSVKKEG